MSGKALSAFDVGWARWRTEAQACLSAALSVVVAVYPQAGSVSSSGVCGVLVLVLFPQFWSPGPSIVPILGSVLWGSCSIFVAGALFSDSRVTMDVLTCSGSVVSLFLRCLPEW